MRFESLNVLSLRKTTLLDFAEAKCVPAFAGTTSRFNLTRASLKYLAPGVQQARSLGLVDVRFRQLRLHHGRHHRFI